MSTVVDAMQQRVNVIDESVHKYVATSVNSKARFTLLIYRGIVIFFNGATLVFEHTSVTVEFPSDVVTFK